MRLHKTVAQAQRRDERWRDGEAVGRSPRSAVMQGPAERAPRLRRKDQRKEAR